MKDKITKEIEKWAACKKPFDKQSKPAVTENDKSPKDGTKLTDDLIDAWAQQKNLQTNNF